MNGEQGFGNDLFWVKWDVKPINQPN